MKVVIKLIAPVIVNVSWMPFIHPMQVGLQSPGLLAKLLNIQSEKQNLPTPSRTKSFNGVKFIFLHNGRFASLDNRYGFSAMNLIRRN